jgi:hypothetical protein
LFFGYYSLATQIGVRNTYGLQFFAEYFGTGDAYGPLVYAQAKHDTPKKAARIIRKYLLTKG